MSYRVCLAMLLLAGCNGNDPPPPLPNLPHAFSVDASKWAAQYSQGVLLASNPVSFAFPMPEGYIGYLTTAGVNMAYAKHLVADIEVTGGAVFNYKTEAGNTCESPPASVRLYFQRTGDNESGQGDYEFYRWWSNPASWSLQPARASLRVELAGNLWSSVFGKFGTQTSSLFASAKANAGRVGMTFGGGCFFGHGVNVTSGSATFILHGFRLE